MTNRLAEKVRNTNLRQLSSFLRALVELPWLATRLNKRGLQHSGAWADLAGRDQRLPSLPEIGSRVPGIDVQRAKDAARGVNLAVSLMYGPNYCLLRSLELIHQLERMGVPCQLVVGVPKKGVSSPATALAHAWVEVDGIVVNDRQNISADFLAFSGAAGR